MIKKVTILSDKNEEVEIEFSNFYLFGAKVDFEDIRYTNKSIPYMFNLKIDGSKKSESLRELLGHYNGNGCDYCMQSKDSMTYNVGIYSNLLAKLTLSSREAEAVENMERSRRMKTRVESLEL